MLSNCFHNTYRNVDGVFLFVKLQKDTQKKEKKINYYHIIVKPLAN